MVAAAAREAKPGEWIQGRGWHQEKWTAPPQPNVEGFPLEASLSRVSPRNPVLLTHASGHAAFANAKALATGGDHGQHTGSSGRPDPARRAGQAHRPAARDGAEPGAERDSRRRPRTRCGARSTWRCGSACRRASPAFEDAGSPPETIDLLARMLAEKSEGWLRLWVMLRASNARLAPILARYRRIGAEGNRLTVRAIKRQIDGALGSRGAWLLAPYADLPSSSGLNTEDPADIEKTAELAIANGYQLCVHAIGDRANREVLDLYERVFRAPSRTERPALADRARAASERGGHPALRAAGRDRVDAGHPLHVGRALRAGATGSEAGGGGRLRLAEAAARRARW